MPDVPDTPEAELRTRLERLLELADRDPAVKRSLRASPDTVLASHGLSPKDVHDITSARTPIGDEDGCNDGTCFSSACPDTCYVTVCGSTDVGMRPWEAQGRRGPDGAAELQVAAARVAGLARRDKSFARALASDPAAALMSLGDIRVDVARELVMQDPWLSGRLGESMPLADCDYFTCACSDGCCVTCWIGSSALVGDLGASVIPDFGGSVQGINVLPQRDALLRNLVERGHITRPW